MALNSPNSLNLASQRHALEFTGLSFQKATQPDILKAYSCNIKALTFPNVSKPGTSEAHSGNAMALGFPKVSNLASEMHTLTK